jgi:hypothetical protein
MSKNIITRDGSQFLLCPIFKTDGVIDVEAIAQRARELASEEHAAETTDFASVAAEVNAYLLENPGLRTVAMPELERSIWERRVEAGLLKKEIDVLDANGKLTGEKKTVPLTRDEKNALADRLSTVLPAYIRSATDRFHVGKKVGVAVRFVEGEVMKDDEGNPMYDATGKEVPRFRHSAEEWAKITEKKSKEGETPASTKAANGAAAHA